MRSSLSAPSRLHNAVAEPPAQFRRIGTVGAVHLYAAAHGNKAKHIVAIDGVAALCQREIDALQVAVYHQHIVVAPCLLLFKVVEVELFGTARGSRCIQVQVEVAHLYILLYHLVHINLLVGNLLVEVARPFKSHLLDGVGHGALREFNLAVLELPLQHFLGIESVFLPGFFQGEAQFRLGTRCFHNVQPVLLGLLVALGHNFHGVARVERLANGHHAPVHPGTNASVAHARMNVVGKVEHRCPLRKLQQIAFGGEHKHLVFVEVEPELVHHLKVVARFQGRANVIQPLVNPGFAALHSLVAPVGSKAALCHLVHALGSYLHLHPLVFGSQHGNVQALVAVALGHREPVAQPLGVGLIHVGNNRECLPALHLFFLDGRVDDDANGKQVVDALETALLFLHLLPDGVYRLGAPFHVKLQACLLQMFLHRSNETLDVGIAALLGGIELLLNHIVGIVLEIFQAQVFKLALQLIESELVGQRRIQIGSLLAHTVLCLGVGCVFDLPHKVHTVGNHNQNHTHILGEREQQVAEVLALNNRTLLVELVNALQTIHNGGHALAKRAAQLVNAFAVVAHGGVEHNGENAIAPQPNLFGCNQCCLQGRNNGVQSKNVAAEGVVLHCIPQGIENQLGIGRLQAIGHQVAQLPKQV